MPATRPAKSRSSVRRSRARRACRFSILTRPLPGRNESHWSIPPMNWTLWALLSAFFAGLTAVLAKIGVTGVDSNLATAVRTTVVLIFTWSIAFASSANALASLSRLSHRTWVFLVLSGVATGLSWLCYFRALQLGEASRVAPVDKLCVVIAIALAAIFLREHLTWLHWVGGSLIFTGAVVLAYS